MTGWHYIRELDRLFADAEFWAQWSDRLHPDEKRAIANGEIDVIRRPLEPTWTVGEWIEAANNLWIRPQGAKFVHRLSSAWPYPGYRIEFTMRDFRAPRGNSVRGRATRESLDNVTTLVPFTKSVGEPERVDPPDEAPLRSRLWRAEAMRDAIRRAA